MRLIGIGHKARQGKTTLGEFLHSLRPADSAVLHLGDSLKSLARLQHKMEKKDPKLLQTLGDKLRDEDPAIFLKDLHQRALESGKSLIFVPDVRYWNEAEWIQRSGGRLIRVRRIDHTGDQVIANDRDPLHQSEIDLEMWDEWDAKIDAGSVEELKEKALDSALWRNLR